MQNFLEKLLNNLVVAAFIPSLVFCIVILLIFKDSMSSTLLVNIGTVFKELGLFVLTISFVISLFLVYLREFIFSIYRGSNFPEWLSFVERRRSDRAKVRISLLEEQLIEFDKRKAPKKKYTDEELEKISGLEDELFDCVSNYQIAFPAFGKIYPTRFGNILSAADTCIVHRYGLDPKHFWLRLIQVIPANNLQKIDDSYNQLSLLINSSLLSLFLSFICSSSAVVGYIEMGIWNSIYIVASFFSAVVAIVFYRLSLPIAKTYGQMYCGAFDLFRFEILRQLNLKLPQDSDREADIWNDLSYSFAVGDYFRKIKYKYNHK